MDRLSFDQAVFLLKQIGPAPGAALGSRDALMAYTLLYTLCHYWPSRETPEFRSLLEVFSYLKEAEMSRFLKQRRIMVRKLVRKFDEEVIPVVTNVGFCPTSVNTL